MKSALGFTQGLVLFAVPVITTSTIAIPSQAATFASSVAIGEISNFSHKAYEVDTNTSTKVESIATLGQVSSQANADATLSPDSGFNFAITESKGDGKIYSGIAQSLSSLIGRFKVDSGETFSFNFLAALGLKTEAEDPEFETANAAGSIQFNLFNTKTGELLDSFGLSGQISSFGKNSPPYFQQSAYLVQSAFLNQMSPDPAQPFSSSQISGLYAQAFDQDIDLTLIEVKTNQAAVEAVPEPSTLLGTFLVLGFLPGVKRWRAKMQKQPALATTEQN